MNKVRSRLHSAAKTFIIEALIPFSCFDFDPEELKFKFMVHN